MERHDRIIELLEQIAQNQEKAVQAQQQHLALAQAQLERSSERLNESLALQKAAVARQEQIRNMAIPLLLVLLFLLGYLLVKWRVL